MGGGDAFGWRSAWGSRVVRSWISRRPPHYRKGAVLYPWRPGAPKAFANSCNRVAGIATSPPWRGAQNLGCTTSLLIGLKCFVNFAALFLGRWSLVSLVFLIACWAASTLRWWAWTSAPPA